MIRHLTALITALVTLMVANAGNRVTLTDAAGTPGSEAVVKVNLENDPWPCSSTYPFRRVRNMSTDHAR